MLCIMLKQLICNLKKEEENEEDVQLPQDISQYPTNKKGLRFNSINALE